MKQALEALECLFGIPEQFTGKGGGDVAVWTLGGSYRAQQAIPVLRQAIGQAEKKQAREPKKWVEVECPLCGEMAVAHTHPVLTTPQPQREWVGLTPADFDWLEQVFANKVSNDFVFADIVCVISAKLKEKNT
jgi:hypothetical protein